MSEQQQRKVRFYLDIVPISPRQQSRTSSDPAEEMDRLSSHKRTVSKPCPSMEALNSYGVLSPSPPTDPNTAVRSPSPTSNLSLFERMKRAQVPKPPPPAPQMVPSPQQDVAMEVAESLGDTTAQTPPLTPNHSLFERMKQAQVPKPPSPAHERVPSPQQDVAMELAGTLEDTVVRSPSPTPDLSLFERLKRAQVPKPPSPTPAPQMDLFERMRCAQVPPPPSPPAASELDPFQKLQSAEAASPPSPFEGNLPTEDESRDLQDAGLANTDTEDDGSFAGAPQVQIVAP
ncbi:hypothetical protein EDC04DRAFT_3095204 [Pisolithus marmoratus]|nr:hypothetical protein EDC04DRAFT_3095204 [Pisolithus marmoratus]